MTRDEKGSAVPVDGLTMTTLEIMGMRDNSCRELLEEVLRQVKGVESVDISLIRARGRIIHSRECSPEALLKAVAEAGYVATIVSAG